jgi:hypothetical protein
MSSKSVEEKKKRTVEERQNIMEVMMKVLMSKLDEMINRQGVPSRKEKEVEMPTIRVIVNEKSVGDNFKDKEYKSCYKIGK